MSPSPPTRVLFVRPDTYGDLFLFEPVLRLVRHAWPRAEMAVLIREPYADAVPLFPSVDVRWLTTACNPYREGPGENRVAFDELCHTVRTYAPDCVVAACAAQTWLEAAVAACLPQAWQVSLGQGLTDPILRAALDAVMPVDWPALYPEKIPVEPGLSEWEKNLRLACGLIGGEVPRWWPVAQVPESSRANAAQILAGAGLSTGGFVACAAAGIANVRIKSWPAEHYGELLAWLERERGIRALLIGHVSEWEHLETVRRAARREGVDPALWVGRDGEMPVLAGLLEAARFYFGNDTGALHLAAALGRPVVSIFGGGHWPAFRPVARRSLTVVQPLPCFGCAWDCYFADAPCVRTISPASVKQALERFLHEDSEVQTVFEAEGLDAGALALIRTATPRLRSLHEDRAARGRQVAELTAWLTESEADRAARGKLLEELGAPNASTRADPELGSSVTGADLVIIDDLRFRLQDSREQELAARTEARRFARELSLARRLLKFSFGDPSVGSFRPRPALVIDPATKVSRLRAALTGRKVVFHLDSFQRQGMSLTVSGWAFRRAPTWDGNAASVTLLFRHGATVHSAAASRVLRTDVAAHFAAQRRGISGGARGLEGTGFTCEVPCDSLSPGVGLEMVLRLEHAGMTCEQPTGKWLWL